MDLFCSSIQFYVLSSPSVCKAQQGLPVGIFFCLGIQFYLLLSPYFRFISLLYLDLYVLGDNALISWGSFVFFVFSFFYLIIYIPSTIFQLNRNGSSWVEPVLSWDKCVLLKDHNAVTPVRLEPAALRSRVKHSTTEPLRSKVRGLSCKPNIYVSKSTSELRVRLAPLNRFKPSSKIFYLPFQGGTSFVDLLCFSVLCLLCLLCVSVYMCLVVTCCERVDLLALVCGV